MYYAKSTNSEVVEDCSKTAYVRLNDFEDMVLARGSAPISTITWLEGDIAEVGKVIQQRVREILVANPWLAGKFVSRRGRKNYIAFESTLPETAPLAIAFQIVSAEASSLARSTKVQDVGKICIDGKLILKMHHDWKQPLFMARLVPCADSPTTHFAIVVSMSHVVGDGHTYYTLLNKIRGAQPIASLTVERIANTTQQQESAMGKTESAVLMAPGLISTLLRGVFQMKFAGLFFGSKKYEVQSRCFLIDNDQMTTIKQQEAKAGNIPFVSSNDVVSSWFCQKTKVENSLMALNFRGRLDGHTDQHAGNYENLIFYRNTTGGDSTTPALIRKSLATLKRAVTHETPITFGELARGDINMITNWASFHSPNANYGDAVANEVLHIPVYDMLAVLPTTMACCVIFQARPNQLAVLIAGTLDKMQGLENAPFEAKDGLVG